LTPEYYTNNNEAVINSLLLFFIRETDKHTKVDPNEHSLFGRDMFQVYNQGDSSFLSSDFRELCFLSIATTTVNNRAICIRSTLCQQLLDAAAIDSQDEQQDKKEVGLHLWGVCHLSTLRDIYYGAA
jgi:hypothetical protein